MQLLFLEIAIAQVFLVLIVRLEFGKQSLLHLLSVVY
jgi:hypothetical protein